LPERGNGHKRTHGIEFHSLMGRWICGCGWKSARMNSRKPRGNQRRLKNVVGNQQRFWRYIHPSDSDVEDPEEKRTETLFVPNRQKIHARTPNPTHAIGRCVSSVEFAGMHT